jgi:hypothetical protein
MAMTDPDVKAVEQDRRLQADPELDMSGGRAAPWQTLFAAIAAIAIIVVTLYGLTHQRDETRETAGGPASKTTGAAPPAMQQEGKSQEAAQAGQQGKQGAPQGGQAEPGRQPEPDRQPDQDQKPPSGQGAPPQTTGAAPSDSGSPGAAPPAPSGRASQGQQKK